MATTFLEPGGDADFLLGTTNGFWQNFGLGAPTLVTDFVHGTHAKSIKYAHGGGDIVRAKNGVVAQAGSRISLYVYIVTRPSLTSNVMVVEDSGGAAVVRIRMTSAGVLQLWEDSVQIGTSGATLSTSQWYRLSLAYTITSASVNRFEMYVDGYSSISVTNATITNILPVNITVGNGNNNATFDFRSSDHYIDSSSSLTDTGNIWVTAKRPNANGTINGFTTQIGAGGSGYGTGHSPQVNERPLSTTNGWSMVGAGSAITEEYNIESKSTGDITIQSYDTIVDYAGWVSASSLVSETASIIVNNVSSNISLTSTQTLFTKVAGSTSYPANTGKDIGIITSTTVTTVSLYECGVLVAFIPGVPPPPIAWLTA